MTWSRWSVRAAIGLVAGLTGGCSSGPENAGVLRGTESGQGLRTPFATRVYTATDRNTADFYLTDLPAEVFAGVGDARGGTNAAAAEAALAGKTGSIVHIHMFLAPSAGRTPIESTACSFTVRQLVMAGAESGLYGGGGFLFLRGTIGAERFGGEFRDATLRLLASSAGFADRLGPGEMSGGFEARRDDALAASIGAAFQSRVTQLREGAAPSPAAR